MALERFGFLDGPVVLCFGGSQGSAFLNRIFLDAVAQLPDDCQVIHITGQTDHLEISQIYNKMKKRSFVRDFYAEMEFAYAAADCVVCRAGASTVAEIAFLKKSAILVPLEGAGGHQRDNAKYLSDKKAAILIDQKGLTGAALKDAIESILFGRDLSTAIRQNIGSIDIGVPFEEFAKNIEI